MDLLNKGQIAAIIVSAAIGAAPGGVPQAAVEKYIDEMLAAMMDAALVELVTKGRLVVQLPEDGSEAIYREATEEEQGRVLEAARLF